MTRCRRAIDDYYSATTRHRGDNYNHRNRTGWRHTTAWRPKSSGKKVSFADPLVSYMGEPQLTADFSFQLSQPLCQVAEPERFDPMGIEF
jgi:hypothetical protein